MMDDDLDWEDIESRLYSQVHHASAENQESTALTSSNTNNENNLQSKLNVINLTSKATKYNRYFHTEKDVLPNSPIYISIEQNRNMTTPDSICKSMDNSISLRPNEVESTSNNFANQPQNNITVNQYNIPVIINSELHGGHIVDPNGKFFSVISNSCKKFLEKKRRRREKRIAKRKENKEKKRKNNIQGNLNSLIVELDVKENHERKVNDIICVSDESNSECIIIHDTDLSEVQVTKNISTGFPKKYNEGDEHSKKPESDDDIIYIPPPPVEVINIDIDENKEKEQDKDTAAVENQPRNQRDCIEGESKTLHDISDFSNFSKPSASKTYNPKERKELLCTPESSASNDFLENVSIENNTNKFNFSLHGSDFNSVAGDFVRPAKPVEFCETESSCSTNDLNRDFNNSVKTIVFDEVEFPKADIFSENNLESFSSYITPQRNIKCSTQVNMKESQSTSSDSSSESDFEPSEDLRKMKEFRKLPYLSPMQFSDTAVIKKKPKKNTASEFFKEQPNVLCETKKDVRKRKSDIVEISETDSNSSVEKLADIRKKPPNKKHKTNNEEAICMGKKKKGSLLETNVVCERKKKYKNSDYNLEKPQSKRKKNTSNSEESEECTNLNINQSKKKKTSLESKNAEYQRKKKLSFDSTDFNYEEGPDTEVTMKRKKKKSCSLQSTQILEHEDFKDLPKIDKVKKKSSENSGNEDTSVEKKSKKRQKSSSTSSNKPLDVSSDEYVEVELLDEVDKEVGEPTKSIVYNLEAELYKLPDHKNSQVNAFIEHKENIFDNFGGTVQHNNNDTYEESSANFVTISEISNVQEIKQNDSDEEIVVDDEMDSNLSSLIVVDEINSTATDQQNMNIVLSSDSENDVKNEDLADLGKNLELANCTSDRHRIDNFSEEIVVVDNTSESTSTGQHALQKNYSEFDVDAIQRTQTDDPEAWKISHKDRITHLNSDRSKGPRCNRCRQFGHIAIRCTEKRESTNCSLCGFPGHDEPRCTKKICTQCGNEGDYSTSYCWKCFKFRNSICRICNMKGHIAKTCPDLWRRYHLTTEEGPIVVSREPQLKPRNDQWCSGCAKQGHLEHECNYYNRTYPPTNPCIMSYADVLDEGRHKLPQEVVTPSVNIPFSKEFPKVLSNAGISSSNIPPLMSLNLPLLPSSQNLPNVLSDVGTNASNSIPPFMPLSPDCQERLVIQSGINYVVKLPNKRLNQLPSSVNANNPQSKNPVLDKMRLTYLNEVNNDIQAEGLLIDPHKVKEGTRELCRNDQRRTKHIIMSMPCHKVREFLKREMADLEDVATQSDPKYLKKMIFKYDDLSKSKRPLRYGYLKEQCFWNRILNMFIFGVHKYRDGALHLNYLQSYLSEPKRNKLDVHKRRSLFSSYSYIFGVDRHANVSYRKFMHRIMERYSQGRKRHFS